MLNMRARDPQKNGAYFGSPKGEVGEIDTRAPFQSVKAAVSLFGEVAVSKDKPAIRKSNSRLSFENDLDKETQLVFAQREMDKQKQKLESDEITSARAHSELERAKITLNELINNLKSVCESKHSAIEAAEAIKERVKQIEIAKHQELLGNASRERELELEREHYMMISRELDAAKQELTKAQQDFDALMNSKMAALQQAAQAQRSASINAEKADELSKEIRRMRESYQELQVVSARAQQQQAIILAEKEAQTQAFQTAKEEAEKQLEDLKKECDPEQIKNIEMKLKETTKEIELVQEKTNKAHAFEMDTMKLVTTELNQATRTLQEMTDQENSLRSTVTSLRMELGNARNEKTELLEIEARKESLCEHSLKLEQLCSETENARKDAEKMKKKARELNLEVESARLMAKEAEGKLATVLRGAEEAKSEEKKVHDEMKNISERKNPETDDSRNSIKISPDEFVSLKKKVDEYKDMAETKVAGAIAQVEVINASKKEAEKRLEANLKAVEEIKEATEMALKSAEMAEAAQSVVEGELQRWRQNQEVTAA